MRASKRRSPSVTRLPEVMDLTTAASLANDLLAMRGRPITLDASAVRRLGGLGLQVLLSARLTWRDDGIAFAIVDPSEAFSSQMSVFGGPAFCNSEEQPQS